MTLDDLLEAAFLDLFAFSELLIGDPLREELIEVEFVIAEELQTRGLYQCKIDDGIDYYLKLQDCALVYGRIFEYIEVEGSANVFFGFLAPFEGGKADLECVHAGAVVHQLLIPILHRVVVVLSIVVAHIQT